MASASSSGNFFGNENVKSTEYKHVNLCRIKEDEENLDLRTELFANDITVIVENSGKITLSSLEVLLWEFCIKGYTITELGSYFLVFKSLFDVPLPYDSFLLRFRTSQDQKDFLAIVLNLSQFSKTSIFDVSKSGVSEFDSRTDASSAQQYFEFYGFLSQQQNMLQDAARTGTYHKAILENAADFHGKVVMDVGTGTGILSFFAVQAGARKVYAVEASSMAVNCKQLVAANNLLNVIEVVTGKVEDISIPEEVDIIVSEPMGYMLLNERMLESYVHARRFLKKGGRMFPTIADLHIALFTDEIMYQEQVNRASFWTSQSFYGVNLASLRSSALNEIFSQPIVDCWLPDILITKSIKWSFNFETDPLEKLHNITIPYRFEVFRTCWCHGIATWFDVLFDGTQTKIWLSTAPNQPTTHWYQVRCVLPIPVLVKQGQFVSGQLTLKANDKQSYYTTFDLEVNNVKHCSKPIDLKLPFFRYGASNTWSSSVSKSECPSASLTESVEQSQNHYPPPPPPAAPHEQQINPLSYQINLEDSLNKANGALKRAKRQFQELAAGTPEF